MPCLGYKIFYKDVTLSKKLVTNGYTCFEIVTIVVIAIDSILKIEHQAIKKASSTGKVEELGSSSITDGA
ncbi:hypothetical protein GCK72_001617 [Caenorhabditis remanei]|uniref:Uncharacterized protein n=1 Tax=Caenorhabditis remanei TaxID=31234 RepID=A0A6A5HNH5_CAERE|nr:hypothetical protein GCK72_001617 [Caenorhabditis remanei]KAF1769800.1 hypothetical protein GCK72_001617 [Caenorhabditis remanei]